MSRHWREPWRAPVPAAQLAPYRRFRRFLVDFVVTVACLAMAGGIVSFALYQLATQDLP